MANKKVFVVTGVDLGWDCVVAVVEADSAKDVRAAIGNKEEYLVTECTVESLEVFAATMSD